MIVRNLGRLSLLNPNSYIVIGVEDEDNKISIQHLLQVGRPDSPHIVKHWRQDWLFENTDFYTYNGDNEWVFETKSF